MSPSWVVAVASLAYLAVLFGVATWADRRASAGRGVIGNPWVYALSLAVYASSWTFYGSVGRAAREGVTFLPVYLGPTLTFAVAWSVHRRMVRAARTMRIASISDFLAARYGRSARLGAAVTILAVLALVPYVALQLRAIGVTWSLIAPDSEEAVTELVAAIALAIFTILFGARHLDAAERHEGLVAAIATEALVKLAAFLVAGLFATFVLFDGPADLFSRAGGPPVDLDGVGYVDFLALTVLSGLVVLVLPRQFQMAVVENVDERHLRVATWAFPLYLVVINLFVLPIAWAGTSLLGPSVDPDTYVLALPQLAGGETLVLLVFLGGLSAATGMIAVETVALSTMVCNDVTVPVLIRAGMHRAARLGRTVLLVRRFAIVALLLAGFAWHRLLPPMPLVDIGLVSFVGIAQLAPALLAGLYWRGGTRAGVEAGLVAGTLVWAWMLVVPGLVASGFLPGSWVAPGPWGIDWLRAGALGGVQGGSPTTLAIFWSLGANVCAFLAVSLARRPSRAEAVEAARFVDILRVPTTGAGGRGRSGGATVGDVEALLARVVGPDRARSTLAEVGGGKALDGRDVAAPQVVQAIERQLAGVLGSPSARMLVGSLVGAEELEAREVRTLVEEATAAMATSHALEEKTRALEAATWALRENEARLRADIEARERAERALRAARARFQGIVDVAADAIVSTDPAQRITLFNRGAEEMFGWKAEEVLGRPLGVLLPPEVRERHRAHVAAFAAEPDGARRMGERKEVWGLRKDGTRFPAGASISHLTLGEEVVLTVILRDLTEAWEKERAIRDLNRALQERAAALEVVNEELESFTSSVSHDLRAPLRSIDAFSSILEEEQGDRLDENGRAALARVRAAARRMSQLIDDLLALARVTRTELRRAPVDLSRMVEGIAAELAAQQPGRRVRFEIQPDVVADADPKLVRVVLENLLGNAWKYTSRHDTAWIRFASTSPEGAPRVYTVEDDGAGFDMSQAPRLFQPFSRLHATAEFPGTGVGLVTVQRIVRRHGGEVWADAAPERGARFSFHLGERGAP